MRKPFVPWQHRPVWPESLRSVLAFIGWQRVPVRGRSPHRHRKAGRA